MKGGQNKYIVDLSSLLIFLCIDFNMKKTNILIISIEHQISSTQQPWLAMVLVDVGFRCRICSMRISTFLDKSMWVIFDVSSVCSFKHIMLFSLLLTHSFINPHPNCRSNQSSFLTLCHYSTLTYFLIYNAVAK